MNTSGLDYNTQRSKLRMPEYGRDIQDMVDYAVQLPDRAERQRCAAAIVAIMQVVSPREQSGTAGINKYWGHLAFISDFKLDIDYPCDIEQVKHMANRPERMDYPMRHITVRHYGALLPDLLKKLKTMPAGAERDELVRLAANQMKRDLVQWGHGTTDNERVASDLAAFTDGAVQIDPDKFVFAGIEPVKEGEPRKSRKRK